MPQSTLPTAPAWYRWLVLIVMGLAMFGNYYVFDALYPVTPMLQTELGFSDQQIGLLDTAYNVAALLTLVAGGVLIDRLGTVRASTIFSALGAAGGLLIAVLPKVLPEHPALAMACGRFVLGIGAELFIVAATTVVGRWFKGKEVSFALSVQLFIARLGSWTADKSPDLAKGLFTDWQPPLMLAAGLGATWLALTMVYGVLEKSARRRYSIGQAAATDKLVLRDLIRFDRSYWYVVALCVAFYATIFPFRTFANLFFTEGRGVSPETAGSLKSVLPMVSMFGMPIFGLLVDRIGRRSLLMMAGAGLLVPPFLLMAFTSLPLWLSMAMLGVSFALVPAVLWPSVTYLVSESRLGSAFALMTFCQQVGWAAMSWGVGAINDAAGASAKHPSGYVPGLLLFAGLSLLGFVAALLLRRVEQGQASHGLELPKPKQAAA